jgi:hypothetical protein
VPSRFQLRGDSLEGIEWRLFNSHGTRARIVSAEKVTEGGIAGFFARTFYEVTVELRDGEPDDDGGRVGSGSGESAGASSGVSVPGRGAVYGDEAALTGIMVPDGWPISAARQDPATRLRPRAHARSQSSDARKAKATRPAASGIDALLREADAADGSPPAGLAGPDLAGLPDLPDLADDDGGGRPGRGGGEPGVPVVSTGSGDFAALLDELTSSVSPGPSGADPFGDVRPGAPAVPGLISGPGKALLVIGLGLDPVETARSMGTSLGGAVEIRTAGARRAAGMEHVVGRNGIAAARAAASGAGRTVVVAFSLRTDGQVPAAALSDLDADQVWLAVDAARKPADTASWVRKVGWAIEVDALAVLGSQETLTPGTVNELDIPVGWVDGEPAGKATL